MVLHLFQTAVVIVIEPIVLRNTIIVFYKKVYIVRIGNEVFVGGNIWNRKDSENSTKLWNHNRNLLLSSIKGQDVYAKKTHLFDTIFIRCQLTQHSSVMSSLV